MSELSPKGVSEGYGACSDEAAAPAWSFWRAWNCSALLVCWINNPSVPGSFNWGSREAELVILLTCYLLIA